MKMSYERKKKNVGYLFIFPWVIGFCVFFAYPLIISIIYSVSKVDAINFTTTFAGADNYQYAFFQDSKFYRTLITVMTDMIYEVPIIIMFSMFVAFILNQKFIGRTFFRSVLFLPFIISSGVIIVLLKNEIMASSLGTQGSYLFKVINFDQLLIQAGIDESIVSFLLKIINRIISITWKSGVQIIILLSGIQGIPDTLYEASSIEGASEWDNFWHITFPLVMPVIFVCMVYSIIDSFTNFENEVIKLIHNTSFTTLNFGLSAAESWSFFSVIIFFLLICYFLFGRRIQYLSD